jgi:hypothetical protein
MMFTLPDIISSGILGACLAIGIINLQRGDKMWALIMAACVLLNLLGIIF